MSTIFGVTQLLFVSIEIEDPVVAEGEATQHHILDTFITTLPLIDFLKH